MADATSDPTIPGVTDPDLSSEPPPRSRARTLGIVALVLALVAAVVVAVRVRRKIGVIAGATAGIEAELASLDPVERAAVLAQLARDTVRDVRATRD